MDGSNIIARSLKDIGVEVVFGIVGIPVIDVAEAIKKQGIRFVSFRNEQAASYAASVYGYLSGKPGVLLVVGGPGVIHALAGVHNATANCWPLLLLAGSNDSDQTTLGSFQELDQVSLLKNLDAKFSTRPNEVSAIPYSISRAYSIAASDRPGVTYVDLPADYIQSTNVQYHPIPLHQRTPPSASAEGIRTIVSALKTAKNPLFVIGKGAAYARAEQELTSLVNETNVPFLPTPMGKGVISDDHALNASAARSTALAQTDLVILFGARLNWILHFGESVKWKSKPRFIQIDISSQDARTDLILGDIRLVTQQILQKVKGWKYNGSFGQTIHHQSSINTRSLQAKLENASVPLSYHFVYATLKKQIPPNSIIVSEGANTMDIARSVFDFNQPRQRLDAGTQATMGLGLGYAISAQLVHPSSKVIAIEGDSAFGFSAMEIETAVREKLPILIIVMNNNGVYQGLDSTEYNSLSHNDRPSTALSIETRYDLVCKGLGGEGRIVSTPSELEDGIKEGMKSEGVYLINVLIDPGRKKKLV